MLSLLLLSRLANAAPAMDTASGDVFCYGAYPTDLVPQDGSEDVPPATVPAMLVNADCGASDITVTLTPDAGPATTLVVSPSTTGVYWLSALVLAPDTTYVLTATQVDFGALSSTFRTGSDGFAVSGAPGLVIDGASLPADSDVASVAVTRTLVPDPAGAIFTLLRDGVAITSGLGNGSTVDSFYAEDGQEACYAVTQYLGDGSELGTSPEACVTLVKDAPTSKTGCASASAAPSAIAALAGLGAALATRRRRA